MLAPIAPAVQRSVLHGGESGDQWRTTRLHQQIFQARADQRCIAAFATQQHLRQLRALRHEFA